MKTRLLVSLIAILLLAASQAVAEDGPRFSPSPFGIMGYAYSHHFDDPDSFQKASDHMDQYKLSGARWDRRDFWWGRIQPDPDTWEWDYFDRAMDDFREANVNVAIILCYGSAWYQHAPDSEEEIQRFGEYVYQMVKRYKDHVKHWEIWNEPNILPFWAPKPNAEHYTRLLQVSYERAKEADPDCYVIGGSFAGPDVRFLREMYEHGAQGYFDIFSYHSYGNDPTDGMIGNQMRILREVMEEYGDYDMPIWLTETGIYTGPAGVTEQLQAERSVKSSLLWVSHGLERIFQLTLHDWSDSPAEEYAMSYRGLVTYGREPKKFFYAHRVMDRLLGDKPFVSRVPLHPEITFLLFENHDQRILAGWTAEGEEVTTTLDLGTAGIVTTTMMGQEQLLTNSGHSYELTFTQEPLYVEGVGEKISLAALLEIVPEQETVAAGDTIGFDVRFPSDIDRPWPALTLESQVPNLAWNADTSRLTLDVPHGTESGALHVPVSVTFGTMRPVKLHAVVEVTNPYSLDFLPYRNLGIPEGELLVELTNNSTQAVSAVLELEAGEQFHYDSGREVTLGPGESTVERIAVKTAELVSGEEYELTMKVTAAGQTAEAVLPLKVLKAFRLDSPITIDGDLSDWERYEQNILYEMLTEEKFNPSLVGGPEDISANGWLAWDDEAIYFALKVHDDHIHLAYDTVVWNFDSLQVGIDAGNDAVYGEPYNETDFELQIAKLRDGTDLIYAGYYPPGHIESVFREEIDLAIEVDKDAGTIIYELRIPTAVMPPLVTGEGTVFGFNFIHNDNDEGHYLRRLGWLELAPGIGYGKHPFDFYRAIMWPE